MCQLAPRAQTPLPADDHAPGQARRFLTEQVCRAHADGVLDDALLLVSEVVTNAVRHGHPPLTVTVDCSSTRGLRVRVGDAAPASPVLRDADPLEEHGRGMTLVDLLATSWGVETHPHGKAVWFQLTPTQ